MFKQGINELKPSFKIAALGFDSEKLIFPMAKELKFLNLYISYFTFV